MSAISQKSISGITSITTPAGVDNVFTVHTNDTTERFRVDSNGNQVIAGILTASNHIFLSGGDLVINDVISHFGDGNTKIRFPADDTISYETAGSERVRITSAGNVGIGTDNPTTKLNVRGTIQAVDSVTGFVSLTPTGSIEIRRGAGGFIDFSTAASEDYDCRIKQTSGNDLIFETGGSGSASEKLRITSDGKMGLGTASPIGDFEIFNNSGISSCVVRGPKALLAIMGDSDNTGASETEASLMFTSDSHTILNSPLTAHGFEIALINEEPGSGLRFHDGTANAERLRITSAGKVGINETDPEANLEINRGSEGKYLVIGGDDANNGRALTFTSSEGGTGSNGALHTINAKSGNGAIAFATTGTERLRIRSDGSVRVGSTNNTSFTADTGADELVVGDANNGVNRGMTIYNHSGSDGRICFAQPDDDDAGMIKYSHGGNVMQFFVESSERVRIKDNGEINVYRGGNGDVFEYWRVSQSLFVVDNLSNESNTRMRIRNPNGQINYNSSSDYRLKENDVKITDGITRIKKLRPIQFKWKSGTNTYDGFFAHEVSEACPMAVDGTKDQVATADDVSKGYAKNVGDPIYQGIDHGKMVPVLTAALQEAITKIETLEAKVSALEGS